MKLHQKLFWLLIFLLPTQLGYHLWPKWSYVFGLRVDYLAPTIYLTDLLVVGIFGLWGVEKIVNVKCQMSNVKSKSQILKLILPFSIFVFLLITSFLAKNPEVALYKLAKIIEFTLLGFYIVKNRFRMSFFTIPLSLAVVYSSLIALVQFLKQASLGGIFWWLGERTFNVATPGIAKAIINGQLIMRPYGIFSHPNVLAGFILTSLILLGINPGLKRILKWAAVVLGTIAIILSFSRSVWLVGTAVFLLTLIRKKKKHLLLFISGLLFMMVLTFFLFKLPFSTNEAFFQRVYLIKLATLMIKAAPLVGVGLNNFVFRLPDFWPTAGFTYWLQPVHNLYLLIMAETGLVGLIMFLWFLFLTFKNLNKQWVTVLLVILLLGMIDHYWFTLQQTQLLLALVLGLSWATKKGKKMLQYFQ